MRLSTFENNREIRFIPPDGEFQLISYRLEQKLKPMFLLDIRIIEYTSSKLELMIKLKSNFKKKCKAQNFNILIAVPCDVQNPKFKLNWNNGSADYHPHKEAIHWKINKFQGLKDIQLIATFSLPSVSAPNRNNFKNIPAELQFDVPSYTVSGVVVKYFKI